MSYTLKFVEKKKTHDYYYYLIYHIDTGEDKY